jgi:hypothetical protein
MRSTGKGKPTTLVTVCVLNVSYLHHCHTPQLIKLVERLGYLFGGGLVRIDDCKKSLLFLIDNSKECSQSENFALGVKSH